MQKNIFSILFFIFILTAGCTKPYYSGHTFYFVCASKYYNFESAYNTSIIIKLRGGSGFVYENKAYFALVSMHNSQQTAKTTLSNMPKDYFLLPIDLSNPFDNLDYYLNYDLYTQRVNFEYYLYSLKSELENCQISLCENKYLFIKADFFVICSLVDKTQNFEQTAKLLQTQLFFDIYHFVLQS